jgi:hypothetical protein
MNYHEVALAGARAANLTPADVLALSRKEVCILAGLGWNDEKDGPVYPNRLAETLDPETLRSHVAESRQGDSNEATAQAIEGAVAAALAGDTNPQAVEVAGKIVPAITARATFLESLSVARIATPVREVTPE